MIIRAGADQGSLSNHDSIELTNEEHIVPIQFLDKKPSKSRDDSTSTLIIILEVPYWKIEENR